MSNEIATTSPAFGQIEPGFIHKNKNVGCIVKLTKCRAAVFNHQQERLGYVCNPRSLKEGTETSRRRTDELGSRLERPIYFECKLNEPMHIGMQLLHPAATDHSMSISRRQVQCIFRFSLRSRAGIRPLSGGTGAVATGRRTGTLRMPFLREVQKQLLIWTIVRCIWKIGGDCNPLGSSRKSAGKHRL